MLQQVDDMCYNNHVLVFQKPEKKWYVFVVESNIRPILETYHNEDAVFKEKPQNVLNLAHCKAINSLNLEKPEMFQIILTEKDLNFIAPSRMERKIWEDVLSAKLADLGIIDSAVPEHVYTPNPRKDTTSDSSMRPSDPSMRPLPPEPVYHDPVQPADMAEAPPSYNEINKYATYDQPVECRRKGNQNIQQPDTVQIPPPVPAARQSRGSLVKPAPRTKHSPTLAQQQTVPAQHSPTLAQQQTVPTQHSPTLAQQQNVPAQQSLSLTRQLHVPAQQPPTKPTSARDPLVSTSSSTREENRSSESDFEDLSSLRIDLLAMPNMDTPTDEATLMPKRLYSSTADTPLDLFDPLGISDHPVSSNLTSSDLNDDLMSLLSPSVDSNASRNTERESSNAVSSVPDNNPRSPIQMVDRIYGESWTAHSRQPEQSCSSEAPVKMLSDVYGESWNASSAKDVNKTIDRHGDTLNNGNTTDLSNDTIQEALATYDVPKSLKLSDKPSSSTTTDTPASPTTPEIPPRKPRQLSMPVDSGPEALDLVDTTPQNNYPRSLSRQVSLKQGQIEKLKAEIETSKTRGLSVLVKPHDCLFAFVDYENSVWIAGWNQKKAPHLSEGFHIGDRLLEINGTQIVSAAQANKLIKLSEQQPKVRIVIHRCPHAFAFCINREAEGQDLGLSRVDGTAQITYVSPLGLASRYGLSEVAVSLHSKPINWWITEINNRPLDLFFNKREIQYRLDAVGKDISLVVQPMDLVLGIRKQLKQIRSYKNFIIS